MSEHSKGRLRCDVCRTINLAKNLKHPKPDMQMYDKCTPMKRVECPTVTELPLQPTCIKVCTKEEYQMRRKSPMVARMPYYAHGKLLYAVKAGILVGAVYFTYTQGVWGNQQDVNECLRRWQEYIRSINTRRPPTFDQCGKVLGPIAKHKHKIPILETEDETYRSNSLAKEKKESVESVVAPFYGIYKSIITTCFAGVVKIPLLLKCAYFDYLKALEKKYEEEVRERAIKRRG